MISNIEGGERGGARMEAVRDALRERNTKRLSFFFKTILTGAGISYIYHSLEIAIQYFVRGYYESFVKSFAYTI